MSKESVHSAIELVNILTDYIETIVILIQKRKSLLEKALNEIDANDLLKAIYGTLIAFLCINLTLKKELKSEERFSAIVEAGNEYARVLDAYIDTLDILTNPEEDEYLRNIKE